MFNALLFIPIKGCVCVFVCICTHALACVNQQQRLSGLRDRVERDAVIFFFFFFTEVHTVSYIPTQREGVDIEGEIKFRIA